MNEALGKFSPSDFNKECKQHKQCEQIITNMLSGDRRLSYFSTFDDYSFLMCVNV